MVVTTGVWCCWRPVGRGWDATLTAENDLALRVLSAQLRNPGLGGQQAGSKQWSGALGLFTRSSERASRTKRIHKWPEPVDESSSTKSKH